MDARIFAFATLPFLMACSEGEEAANTSVPVNHSAASLTGNWQVAAIDGQPTTGVQLTGTENVLGWAPSCAGWLIRYQQSERSIRFRRLGNTGQITTVCDVGYPESLPQIFGLLPGMNKVDAAREDQLILSGNGHSLTLERPVPRSEKAVPTLRGTWRVSSLNGNAVPEGTAPTFIGDENVISWTVRCAQQGRTYYIENDRFTARELPPLVPPPPPPLQVSRPICAIGLPPYLEEAFQALDAAVKISRVEGGGIKLESGDRTLTLHPTEPEAQP